MSIRMDIKKLEELQRKGLKVRDWNGKPLNDQPVSKYNAVKSTSTMIDGHSFPSKLERDVAETLMILQKAGVISDLRFQHCIDVGPDARWKVDFSYTEKGETIFHEAKGMEDETYRRKKKLFAKYRSEELRISKRTSKRNHRIVEVINGRR